MRPFAGLVIALGCCAGAAAAAEVPSTSGAALNRAAFAVPRVDPLLSPVGEDSIAALAGRAVDAAVLAPRRWSVSQFVLPVRGSAVDSVRVSVGQVLRPGGLPLNLGRAEADDQAYEVALTRDWPGAMSFAAGAYDVAVTPHAGLGVGSYGGSAEAGATLTLGQRVGKSLKSQLISMGVRDGAVFGDEGRWYLFAAASGRAVGLNMQRVADGWDRAGWSTDTSSALIGDAQLGLAWRKGPMQSSFGYIRREVKGEHMLWGQETKADSLVAFSLSIKPRR